MGRYILRRILIMLPTLFVIMVVSFLISQNMPGDPIALELSTGSDSNMVVDRDLRMREYIRARKRLGVDKPVFFFAIHSLADPDTLYRIVDFSDRNALENLVERYGNWDEISAYHHAIVREERAAWEMDVTGPLESDYNGAVRTLLDLRNADTPEEIAYHLEYLDEVGSNHGDSLIFFSEASARIQADFDAMKSRSTNWKNYVPSFTWYGFDNQFGHWLGRMLTLDLGKSRPDRLPVAMKIGDALPWTVFMGLFSFIVAYLIAIPIGVYSVRNRNQWQDQTVTTGLFLLYSVPSFVAALLLMTLFCNPEYLYWFPTGGVQSDGAENWTWWQQMKDYAYHLFLPTLVYSYGSVAFLSRQMRTGMLENVAMDYIRTARAKGLSERVVHWKHAMRNSILPLVTHFSSLFPRLIGGAVIIETIFSIPGMGRLTLNASFSNDYPVLMAVFTFSAILTQMGILVSDILYAVVDPRISYTKS